MEYRQLPVRRVHNAQTTRVQVRARARAYALTGCRVNAEKNFRLARVKTERVITGETHSGSKNDILEIGERSVKCTHTTILNSNTFLFYRDIRRIEDKYVSRKMVFIVAYVGRENARLKSIEGVRKRRTGETIVSRERRLIHIYVCLELKVARTALSDLRALDTLRGNKCASLRFHGGRYVVLVTACLFVPPPPSRPLLYTISRGTSTNVIAPRVSDV